MWLLLCKMGMIYKLLGYLVCVHLLASVLLIFLFKLLVLHENFIQVVLKKLILLPKIVINTYMYILRAHQLPGHTL